MSDSSENVPGVGDYEGAAGGWGALKAVALAVRGQMDVVKETRGLLTMNQPTGFDCPGCAWPDPKHTSSFEFCENGAKAVSWEATAKRDDAGVLRSTHGERTVDYGPTSTSRMKAASPIRSSTIAPPIGICRSRGTTPSRGSAPRCAPCPIPTWRSSIPPAARRTRPPSSISSSPANTAPTIFPTAPTCATRRPASACRNRSASARAR